MNAIRPSQVGKFFEWLNSLVERLLPWLSLLGAGALYYWYLRRIVSADLLKELLPAALNAASISVGFLISGKAILLSIANSRIVRTLRQNKSFSRLIGYFISATWWSAAVALLSIALLWVKPVNEMSSSLSCFVGVWISVSGGALGATFRTVHFFSGLVREVSSEPISQ